MICSGLAARFLSVGPLQLSVPRLACCPARCPGATAGGFLVGLLPGCSVHLLWTNVHVSRSCERHIRERVLTGAARHNQGRWMTPPASSASPFLREAFLPSVPRCCSVRLQMPASTLAVLLNVFSLHPGFRSLKI